MANGLVLMSLAVAHYRESKLPWLLVAVTQAHSGNADEHIIFLEFNCSSFGAFRRIDHIGLSVAVNNFEAAQVLFILFIDGDLLDR